MPSCRNVLKVESYNVGCRILIVSTVLVSSTCFLFSQGLPANIFGISGGLGVTVINATDVVDYINGVSPSTNRQDDFASAAEFFGTSELRLSDSWGVKFEYAYLIKSYAVDAGAGKLDYFYGVHMPTLMAQYLDFQTGYVFKLGGGLGYHFASFSETLQGATSRDLKSSGLGLKLEAEANTALGDHLYGMVAGDIRADFMSTLKDGSGNTLPKNPKMSFFAFGLKFGLIYYF